MRKGLRWSDSALFRATLACLALAVALAMASLAYPSPELGLLLFVVGTPLLVGGIAGYAAVVLRDLTRHGVF